MFNSFSSALSALKAHSAAVDTIGNNLANINTTGFKSTDVSFKDIVAESIGGGGKNEVGMGVSRPITVRSFSQGAVQTTSGQLDAAIQGNGFFVVKDGAGSRLLTRDGTFTLDNGGYVVTLTGERVQQYVGGELKDIQVPVGASGAKATTKFNLTANLNAAGKTYNDTTKTGELFSTPVEVVDSLGVTHVLTVQFRKTDAGWDYEVFMPGNEITPPPDPLAPVSLKTGTLEFDENGVMTSPAYDPDSDPPGGTEPIVLENLASGAANMTVNWNLFDDKGGPLLTQFARASSASRTTPDGYPAGEVVAVGLADGGKVIAKYGNGEQKEIGSLCMALISNPSTLAAAGNNTYRVSSDTETPTYGLAGEGGRGKIKAGALEASTVDMAREFTNLIVYQRGYQANSRVVTTADELSQETLNLKR